MGYENPTIFYLRQGECNRCGQCCGASYAFGGAPPIQKSPWSLAWFDGVRTSSEEDILQNFPLVGMIKKVDVETGIGSAKWRGKNYEWVLHSEKSLCKNEIPLTDPETLTEMCPFLVLLGESNTPATACGIVESSVFIGHCDLLPRTRETLQHKEDWENSHPACSYTWVLEE